MAKEKSPLTLEIAQYHTEKVRASYLEFHNIIDEAFDAGLHVDVDCLTREVNGRLKPLLTAHAYIDVTDLAEVA